MSGVASQQSKPSDASSPRPGVPTLQVAMHAGMLATLPLLVYYVLFCLEFNRGNLAVPSFEHLAYVPLPTGTSVGIVAGWLAFQVLLQIFAPGRWVEGEPTSDGTRLSYKMNGWFAFWFTSAAIAAGVTLQVIPPTILADQFGPLLTTANIVTFLFCFYLYRAGRRAPLPRERIVHDAVRAFWLGTALNPRIATFDLKLFCEARPGLIAWLAIDLSLAAKQYEVHGFVTVPMILVCLFHFWYVADYFFHEEAILTTWDIRHENFGWMLCWGSLVWVPFIYTIQAYYLVDHLHNLPWWAAAGLVLLNFTGYTVFRGANLDKHRFRRDPTRPIWGKPAASIKTARGSLLLVSGWWGLSRHMNYFGDLLMALAWCLPCGFGSPLPYLYFVYCVILLVHRERRDHRRCAATYGDDWTAYCKQVPYRIVPWVY